MVKKKKISISGRKYSMKDYIKTWGVEDDFFIKHATGLKGAEIYHSKISMKDGKIGLISNTGALKRLFKKEIFLPFEVLFPTKKNIFINYCDGTNFGTLDTLNREYSQKKDINQIFKDYYNDEESEHGDYDEDPYMEDRDEKTWKSPHSTEDEWEYLKAYFNHNYQNENTQICLLEEPLAYARRNGRTKANLKKYIINMNYVFENENLNLMLGIIIN